jgi:metal-dependent hydrolase (beta-lactamase superfamily II)
MLPAENGDCLWVEYGDSASPRRVIIDCGAKSAADLLAERIGRLDAAARDFELFVLTHIDSDHIAGVPKFFTSLPAETTFGEIWFNGWQQLPKEKLGVRQGEEFSELLGQEQFRPQWNRSFGKRGDVPGPVEVAPRGTLPEVFLADELRVTVLSPGIIQLQELSRKWLQGLQELHPDKMRSDFLASAANKPGPPPHPDKFDLKELADTKTSPDGSVANGSSIALLLEFEGKAVLLTGDAHAEVITASVRRLLAQRGLPKLRLDAMKLSHHGSRNALTKELLEVVDCPKYLVSTNGSKFWHPDREAIARVIVYGGQNPTLCFNYRSEFNDLWDNPGLKQRYGYQALYPAAQPGLRVPLAGETGNLAAAVVTADARNLRVRRRPSKR